MIIVIVYIAFIVTFLALSYCGLSFLYEVFFTKKESLLNKEYTTDDEDEEELQDNSSNFVQKQTKAFNYLSKIEYTEE